MIQLKEGYISYTNLSLWFGLSEQYFAKATKKAKEKKLKILEAYADYHLEGKDIIIDSVKTPIYSKAKKIIEKKFEKEWGNINNFTKKECLDTCSRVGKAIYRKNEEIQKQISENTTIGYTNIIKREQYGKNYSFNNKGTKGYSKYVYLNEKGTDYLNKEQMKIMKECADEAFQCNIDIMQIIEDYKNGEITAKERNEALNEILNYNDLETKYINYKTLLIEKLGFEPIKRTKLTKY